MQCCKKSKSYLKKMCVKILIGKSESAIGIVLECSLEVSDMKCNSVSKVKVNKTLFHVCINGILGAEIASNCQTCY